MSLFTRRKPVDVPQAAPKPSTPHIIDVHLFTVGDRVRLELENTHTGETHFVSMGPSLARQVARGINALADQIGAPQLL